MPKIHIRGQLADAGRHTVGPALIILGQPLLTKRSVMAGSATGTSIVSKYLSKALPHTFTSLFGKEVGIFLSKRIGTNMAGRALGRMVPFLGWGLTVYDAADTWSDYSRTHPEDAVKALTAACSF